MYSQTQYLHNLATMDTNGLITYILDFSGFGLHSEFVCLCSFVESMPVLGTCSLSSLAHSSSVLKIS